MPRSPKGGARCVRIPLDLRVASRATIGTRGVASAMREALHSGLEEAVRETETPGAVAYVGDLHQTYLDAATGLRQVIPEPLPAGTSTVYDVASLTKCVATTTAVLMLCHDGAMDLDQPASELVPIPAFGAFTVRHLLTHTAGLVPGLPYYRSAVTIDEMLQRYAARGLDHPPGTQRRYSDVGFMILGRAVELTAHDSLDMFCARRIFKPLAMNQTTFNPPGGSAYTCAATEACAWRGKVMVGAVHDENAYAVGGVAGHAGLFSTAQDLGRFCRALLGGELLPEHVLAQALSFGQVAFYPWQGLGWNLDPWPTSVNGFLPARTAFGHTGWTGCSLWLDRASGLFAILLANTCHPARTKRDNKTLRRVFHTAVAREFYPHRTNTHTGLDRLLWEQFRTLRGKRIALLTHHAAVDQLGRPILDVLGLEPRVKVALLYSPEHGFHGQAEAGQKVDSESGEIPLISLYGNRSRPTAHELKDIDLFVVDLQDVGARYYTYPHTMLECMRACADARIPMLVLDRPNPLGGNVLEGPIASDTSHAVCCAPVPIRHGMTIGELALFLRGRALSGSGGLDLAISALDSWQPERLFAECDLPWIPPSPNIPSPQTALLYVGTCLFEGTNLNEGRGTETPFQIIGAPWLAAETIIRDIGPGLRTGCSLEPVIYTPKAMPGKASSPTYCDRQCNGIRIRVRDPHKVRAFTLTVALLDAIRKRHPEQFAWKRSFDVLAGSDTLRKHIETGASVERIIASCQAGLDAFRRARPR
ncbi:MAG TPA: DUF1343 domain-containing protein, partial [Candidatus Hydrogenedentes bacterium]|nr:DUF1343 domain-containing protein [Candidatus Hydrogenedentota bacterium]